MQSDFTNLPQHSSDPEASSRSDEIQHDNLTWIPKGAPESPEPRVESTGESAEGSPAFDSCYDDLNVVLSESIQQPDPDPNLASSVERAAHPDAAGATSGRRTPRTSEIFRSVVAPGDHAAPSPLALPPSTKPMGEARTGLSTDELDVLDAAKPSAPSTDAAESSETGVPWGQILLLSYSSILTLALIWLLASGRIPSAPQKEQVVDEVEAPAVETTQHDDGPGLPPHSPPIPAENLTTIGKSLILGDLEITPMSVEASSVSLVHTLNHDAKRREDDCLTLRLRLHNRSYDRTLMPLDRLLLRERDTAPFDPYITTEDGQLIRLFPLAPESEWSILGQSFPRLAPGESSETCVVAEPGSALQSKGTLTWRIRLRTGVYQTDLIGVTFKATEIQQIESPPPLNEEPEPEPDIL